MDDLEAEAYARGIRPPSQKTLNKYGLSVRRWLELLRDQGWVCAVCRRSQVIWNTDHEHVPGWAKKPAAERSRYVRGVLCWKCNKLAVDSNLSAADARRIAVYLEAYEARRDATGNRAS